MKHSFDVDIAEKYGLIEAIVLDNLFFWIEHNRANGTNFFDGSYWTYSSVKAFSELFPYLSAKRIRSAIDKLKDKNLVITGNYNKSSYDRTMWYSLSEEALSMCRNRNFHLPEKANGFSQEGEPIPDSKPDSKPNSKTDKASISPSGEEDDFEIFWKAYPNKKAKHDARKAWAKVFKEPDVLNKVLTSLEAHKKSPQWTKDNGAFVPYPATWLNGRRWEDELKAEASGDKKYEKSYLL